MSIVQAYRSLLRDRMGKVFDTQEEAIAKAGEICADSISAPSTSVAIAVGQAINAVTAQALVKRGVAPNIMVRPNTTEKEAANR